MQGTKILSQVFDPCSHFGGNFFAHLVFFGNFFGCLVFQSGEALVCFILRPKGALINVRLQGDFIFIDICFFLEINTSLQTAFFSPCKLLHRPQRCPDSFSFKKRQNIHFYQKGVWFSFSTKYPVKFIAWIEFDPTYLLRGNYDL